MRNRIARVSFPTSICCFVSLTILVLGLITSVHGQLCFGQRAIGRNPDRSDRSDGARCRDHRTESEYWHRNDDPVVGRRRIHCALPRSRYLRSLIEKSGFGTLVLRDVTISVGTRAVIHPQLKVGKIDAVITVSAETPLVDTAASSLGTVVDQQSIQSLPLNGRNFTDFALLTAGSHDGRRLRHDQLQWCFWELQQLHGGWRKQQQRIFFGSKSGVPALPYQFSEDVDPASSKSPVPASRLNSVNQAAAWSTR